MPLAIAETVSEFERLPEPEASSLIFLRSLRDHLAESILSELPDMEKHVERMIRYDSESHSFAVIHGHLTGGYYPMGTERLKVFRLVCRRVARIERARVGLYIPPELETA